MSAVTSTSASAFRWGLVQVSLSGVLWGTAGLASELLNDATGAHPLVLGAWRAAGAAVILLVILVALRQLRPAIDLLRRHPLTVVGAGICTGLYQTLYFQGVAWAGVTVATVVSLGIGPVVATVVEAIAQRRRPSWLSLGVVAVALTGLLLAASAGGHGAGGTRPVEGVLISAAAGIAFGSATLIGRAPAQHAAALPLTTVTTTVSAFPASLLALIPVATQGAAVVPAQTAGQWGGIIYLAAGTMALAYLSLYAGLKHVPGSAALVATLLEPVTAAFAAFVLLGERIGATGWIGTALILFAVVGLSFEAPPADEEDPVRERLPDPAGEERVPVATGPIPRADGDPLGG
ncbi:DMT family transporter [Microbacterium sp. gxy059]|uniref:DMT family transporter n=1 Tax=Microbacterium sp. gxy059 TaxID=2957199 RepID=UPI003D98CADF